jgi:probable addiction module antidote protein
MPKRTQKYEDSLREALQDPEEAAAYLNAHLDNNGEDADDLFLLALRDVVKAHGFSSVAENANLGRESLYKALSETGNPRLSTLSALLDVMGLKFLVAPQEKPRKSA